MTTVHRITKSDAAEQLTVKHFQQLNTGGGDKKERQRQAWREPGAETPPSARVPGRDAQCAAALGRRLPFSQKASWELPPNPAVPLRDTRPREMKVHTNTKSLHSHAVNSGHTWELLCVPESRKTGQIKRAHALGRVPTAEWPTRQRRPPLLSSCEPERGAPTLARGCPGPWPGAPGPQPLLASSLSQPDSASPLRLALCRPWATTATKGHRLVLAKQPRCRGPAPVDPG